MENLGALYFSLGLDDKTFRTKMDAIIKQYGGMIKQVDQGAMVSSKLQTQLKREAGAQQDLIKKTAQAENAVLRLGNAKEKASRSGNKLNTTLSLTKNGMYGNIRVAGQLQNQLGGLFTIYAAERFLKKIIEVRGEFEKQQIALRAILRDAQAADKLFVQFQGLAIKSPFKFKEILGDAKQLSAFGVTATELFNTTKTLADVSAGLGVDMGRIILAYGQVKSASVLRGQELRQFTEAGIPLVQELADKFTLLKGQVVSTADVFDLIKTRQVPFEMVKEVFDDMTSAGGKFYNMQAKLSESVSGKWSNLSDALDIALNKIGQSQEGILKGGIDFTAALIRNWETVGKVLLTVIGIYGTFKAAMLAGRFIDTMLKTQTIGWIGVTAAINNTTRAQVMFNLAAQSMKVSPLVLAMSLLAGATVAVIGGISALQPKLASTQEITDSLTLSMANFTESGKNLTSLMSRYDELKATIQANKDEINALSGSAENQSRISVLTEMNKESQLRLNAVLQEIAKSAPRAATTIDQYGKVLSVNKDIVDAYTENERKNAAERVKIIANEMKQRLELLKANRAVLSGTIAAGMTVQGYGGTKPQLEKAGTQKFIQYNKRADQNVIVGYIQLLDQIDAKIAELLPGYEDAMDAIAKHTKSAADDSSVAMRRHVNNMDYWLGNAGDFVTNWNKKVAGMLPMAPNMPGVAAGVGAIDANWRDKYNKKVAGIKGISSTDKTNLLFGTEDMKDETMTESAFAAKIKKMYEDQNLILQTQIRKRTKIRDEELETRIKQQTKLVATYKLAAQYAGAEFETKGGGGETAAQKAAKKQAERVKARIDLIKEAYEAYKKFYELGNTASESTALTKALPEFAGLTTIPTNLTELESSLKTALVPLAKNTTDEANKVRLESDKTYSDASIKVAEDTVRKTIDAMTSSIEAYKPQFTLYEKILGATGNKNLAKSTAFGSTAFLGTPIEQMKAEFKKASGLTFSPDLVLPENTRQEIKQLFKEITDEIRTGIGSTMDELSNMIAESGTAQQKIDQITANYEKRKKEAEGEFLDLGIGLTDQADIDALTEKMQTFFALLKKAKDDKVSDVLSDAFAGSEVYMKLFGDATELSKKGLKELLDLAKKIADPLSGAKKNTDGKTYSFLDPETGKTLTLTAKNFEQVLKQIPELEKRIRDIDPFEKLFKPGGESFEDKAKGVSEALQEMAGYARQLGDALGQEKGGQIAASLLSAGSSIAKLASGTDITAGIIGLISAVRSLYDIANEQQAELERRYLARIKYQQDLNDAIREQNYLLERAGTIFDENSYGKFVSYVNQSNDAISKLNEVRDALKNAIKNYIDAYNKQGGSSSGIGANAIAKMQGLEKVYAAYWKDGVFDSVAAKIALADKETAKLSDSQAAYLQQAYDAYVEYAAAQEQLSGYLSGIFGEIGSQMMDSITSSLDGSKNAVDDFTSYASDAIWNMVEDIAYSMYLAPVFEKMQAEIKAAMGDTNTNDAQQTIDIFAAYSESISGATAETTAYLDSLRVYMESKGFDIAASAASSLKQEIKGVSEDTASRLASMLNSVRATSAQSSSYLSDIKAIAQENNTQTNTQLTKLNETMSAQLTVTKEIKAVIDSVVTTGAGGKGIRVV